MSATSSATRTTASEPPAATTRQNRFDKGKCNPADLVLTGTLNFKNEADAKAYCDAVNDRNRNTYFNSKARDQDSYKVNATCSGKTVTVTFE